MNFGDQHEAEKEDLRVADFERTNCVSIWIKTYAEFESKGLYSNSNDNDVDGTEFIETLTDKKNRRIKDVIRIVSIWMRTLEKIKAEKSRLKKAIKDSEVALGKRSLEKTAITKQKRATDILESDGEELLDSESKSQSEQEPDVDQSDPEAAKDLDSNFHEGDEDEAEEVQKEFVKAIGKSKARDGGFDGEKHKENVADCQGVALKTFSDYMYFIKTGRKLNFDFNTHIDEKMIVLRNFVKNKKGQLDFGEPNQTTKQSGSWKNQSNRLTGGNDLDPQMEDYLMKMPTK